MIQIPYSLFQKMEAEGELTNSFNETSITVIPDRDIKERKTQDRNLSWT